MAAKEISVKKYVVRLSAEEREQLGRAFRPAAGPVHEPHWMLLTTGSMQMPGSSAGWARSIDEAKEEVLRAWHAWLEWAELHHSRQRP